MKTDSTQPDDYEESSDSLLSTKMKQLNDRNILQTSTLLQHSLPLPRISTHIQLQTSSIKSEQSVLRSVKKMRKNHFRSSRSRHKNIKQQEPESMSDFLRRKGVRLFQMVKGGDQGRKAIMTQIKDVPVTEFTGLGILVLPNGKKYNGEWVDGLLMSPAKITYANGDVYNGDVYQYEKHGKGELSFKDGRYVGEFSGSDFHGEGTLYDRDNNIVYEGIWRRGNRYDF